MGPSEQAGRIDAVDLQQGGKESRGLPAAMRNLVDEPLAFRPSRAGGSCWFFVHVSSMNTNRLGSIRP